MKMVKETPYRYRIEQRPPCACPASSSPPDVLPDAHGDMALVQVANVATLPGIVRASYAMPDVHWGYGFPDRRGRRHRHRRWRGGLPRR